MFENIIPKAMRNEVAMNHNKCQRITWVCQYTG